MGAEDVIEGADPDDGLSVQRVNLGNGADVSLHIVFRAGGELVPLMAIGGKLNNGSAEIWRAVAPESRAMGAHARMEAAMSAACRFVNTGGNIHDLQHAVESLNSLLYLNREYTQPIELTIPGFHLLTTGVNDEGEHEHLFAADDGGFEGIRWVEGRFIEPVDLSDVLEEGEVDPASTVEMELLPEPSSGAAEGTEETPEV
jgi:hypothetical protein